MPSLSSARFTVRMKEGAWIPGQLAFLDLLSHRKTVPRAPCQALTAHGPSPSQLELEIVVPSTVRPPALRGLGDPSLIREEGLRTTITGISSGADARRP